MKTSKLSTISGMFALALIVTLALTACPADTNSGETPTARSAGTEKPLTFGTNCKKKIKSDDKFTNAEWNTLCDKVVAAIEGTRGYNKAGNTNLNKAAFENVFAGSVTVVLSSSATYNCEVKSGNYTTIYLKTSAVDTVDIKLAVDTMAAGSGTYTS
jgi:hypothetical protein